MTDPLLSVQNLSKSYGALKVTQDLSPNVYEGRIHAVIGPNGAGKTTPFSRLSGQLRPGSGRMVYAGKDITRLNMAGRLRLGLTRSFQLTTLLPTFSVRENVPLVLQACKGPSFRFLRPAANERALNDQMMACPSDLRADANVRAAYLGKEAA